MLRNKFAVNKAVLTYSHPLVFFGRNTVGITDRPQHRAAIIALMVFGIFLTVEKAVRRLLYRNPVYIHRHFLNFTACGANKGVISFAPDYRGLSQITVPGAFL